LQNRSAFAPLRHRWPLTLFLIVGTAILWNTWSHSTGFSTPPSKQKTVATAHRPAIPAQDPSASPRGSADLRERTVRTRDASRPPVISNPTERILFDPKEPWERRSAILDELTQRGDAEAETLLARAADELEDEGTKEAAARALARMGTDHAGRLLLSSWDRTCTENKDVFAGNHFLRALATRDPALLRRDAGEILSRQSPDRRENVFLGYLAGAEPDFAREIAAGVLRRSTDEPRRLQALLMLGYLQGKESQELILERVAVTESKRERLEALDALRRHATMEVALDRLSVQLMTLEDPMEQLLIAHSMASKRSDLANAPEILSHLQRLAGEHAKRTKTAAGSLAFDLSVRLTALEADPVAALLTLNGQLLPGERARHTLLLSELASLRTDKTRPQ
jgi:hypothetical protein